MPASHEIAQKSAVNDLETEKALAQRLRQIFPGCAIIGEEAVASDPALLDTIGDATGLSASLRAPQGPLKRGEGE